MIISILQKRYAGRSPLPVIAVLLRHGKNNIQAAMGNSIINVSSYSYGTTNTFAAGSTEDIGDGDQS
jgi:hypothetical protein